MKTLTIFSAGALAALCFSVLSCGGSSVTPPPAVASVQITPGSSGLYIAQTVQLSAVAKDGGGNVLANRTVLWNSTNSTIASTTSAGLVSALSVGTTDISATSEGQSASITVTVALVPVAAVVVTPSNPSVQAQQGLQLIASTSDAAGNSLFGRTVVWTTTAAGVATVSPSGLLTAVAPGSASITATSEGKSGSTSVTVTPIPVNTVVVTPGTANLNPGAALQLNAATKDIGGNPLTGRTIAWSSGTPSIATVSGTGLATAVAVGTATLTATSEGKSGTSQITVQTCSAGLQLAVGEIHTLTASERASLCIGGGASASEYVLVPFSNSLVAASTLPVELNATNTAAVLAPLALWQSSTINVPRQGMPRATSARQSFEWSFRARERRDLPHNISSARATPRSAQGMGLSYLTGIAATPTVGSIVQLNVGLAGNTCADAKQLHPARVVAVLQNTLVLSDTLSPAGGYSDAEMTAFGQAFDTLGYALDTVNFGPPTDLDANGRVAILFTPGVNVIPGPPGGFIGGLQASRDLFPVSSCLSSNEGEIFYLPVPDPNSTINGSYTNKSGLSNVVLSALVHEFQHLINAGRRIYVNGASSFEESWLNEGLSHIAEELLYYRMSGNSPLTNIDLPRTQSTQAQLDAISIYQVQNLLRLKSYMVAPETNSPYSQVDGLQMRGAIWQLLRYAADRKGGTQRDIWFALVNATIAGQANFNSVLGDISTTARDWSVAQVADDAGLGVATNYTNPSWNFRSMIASVNSGSFPLLTHPLLSAPVALSLSGGGAAYVRFRVAANVAASIAATSSGQPAPASVDFYLVRTQ
jgi:hypothetical protein